MVATFLKVSTLGCSQALTTNLHIFQTGINEGSWQAHRSATQPLQKCYTRLTEWWQEALLLRSHSLINFLPKGVIAHIELWRPLWNLEHFETCFFFRSETSFRAEAMRKCICVSFVLCACVMCLMCLRCASVWRVPYMCMCVCMCMCRCTCICMCLSYVYLYA